MLMKSLLKNAINQGGLGCTLILWTDKYKHNTYMAMTAHFCDVLDEKIEQKSLMIYMGHITDIVNSNHLSSHALLRFLAILVKQKRI